LLSGTATIFGSWLIPLLKFRFIILYIVRVFLVSFLGSVEVLSSNGIAMLLDATADIIKAANIDLLALFLFFMFLQSSFSAFPFYSFVLFINLKIYVCQK
jgi:hypothetical protein